MTFQNNLLRVWRAAQRGQSEVAGDPSSSSRFTSQFYSSQKILIRNFGFTEQRSEDYESIIAAANGSVKEKQLAAQLIPKFFKFFPLRSVNALDQHWNLCEDDDLAVRIQAIRGLPLFCKDTPEHTSKIVDILAQLLLAGENMERDAVHKALMSLLRQDVKTSLTALFSHAGSTDVQGVEELSAWEGIREKVLCFMKDKVFPLSGELLKPQEEMERHITNLVKKNLYDVTTAEFKMFLDFLKSLSLFGQNSPVERVQELMEIIEGQADLDAQLDVSDVYYIGNFASCLQMALPLLVRGGSSSKFTNYLAKQILPVFEKLPEEHKLDLLRNLAECSPFAAPQESRLILPSIVQLLKKYMVRRKIEEIKFSFIECLLYSFHHFAHKAPNATNSTCGYKIVTGQPSDRLGENFTDQYKEFTERLSTIEDLVSFMIKKLIQGMADGNKALTTAKTEEEKNKIIIQQQKATCALRSCNNVLAMAQPLHSKSPSFIGNAKINLSWKEAARHFSAGGSGTNTIKRTAPLGIGSSCIAVKKGRGVGGTLLVHKAFEDLSNGDIGRRDRGWRGRGRGRGSSQGGRDYY